MKEKGKDVINRVIHKCQSFSKVYKENSLWKHPTPQKLYINHFELSRQNYNHSKINRTGILKTTFADFVFNLRKYSDGFGNAYMLIKSRMVKKLIF